MQRKKMMIVTVLAAAFTAAACFAPYNPPCGDIYVACPNGSPNTATCTSDDTKELATYGSDGTCNTTASDTVCNYSCSYVNGSGTVVPCGSTFQEVPGTKPDGESGACPDDCLYGS